MAVMKFGGTSVGTASAMRQVIAIIAEKRKTEIPLVVLSACSGITNKLVKIADTAGTGRLEEALEMAGEVRKFHLDLVGELVGNEVLRQELAGKIDAYVTQLERLTEGIEIVGELSERSKDRICSFGELLSTTVFAAALNEAGVRCEWLDARQVMITDECFGFARPIESICLAKTEEIIRPKLDSGVVVVTQGYIGSTGAGKTTTLGRGGSDLSAALFGAWLQTVSIDIWTDVDGVMTCDPRMVPEARSIRVMTFSEAAELAYLGAKVLHPDTIAPAVKKNIPVYVLNTWHPESKGTLITDDPALLEGKSYGGLVKSIAVRKGQAIVNVRSNRMFGRHGFMRELFEVFERFGVSVEMISTSEVSVSLTVDDAALSDALIQELGTLGDVEIEHKVATVSVVGDNLRMSRGVAGRIFSSLRNVNLRMISQGASEINVGVVVEENDVPSAVSALHCEFFAESQCAGIFEKPAGS
jgi:aspartate kinase